jgi:hypothetical protein
MGNGLIYALTAPQNELLGRIRAPYGIYFQFYFFILYFMEKVKYEQVQFLLDLLELKNHNLHTQSLSIQMGIIAQSNTFHCLIDSLIAHFIDKWNIPYEILIEAYRDSKK